MLDNQFNNRDPYAYSSVSPQALANTVSSTMKRVYLKMTLGLVVTAFVALFCSSNSSYISFYITNRWFSFVLIIAEFALLFLINGSIKRISDSMATALFYLFAAVNGAMLSTIFLAYSATAITKTFFITAGTFGAMSVYGYFTPNDLSRMGSYLIMALFGLIIASLVNIFLKSSTLDWIVSIAGVIIFIGLTAWDTQQIKTMAQQAPSTAISRLATIGALSLYLDFLNLFLFLLRIFGNRD